MASWEPLALALTLTLIALVLALVLVLVNPAQDLIFCTVLYLPLQFPI